MRVCHKAVWLRSMGYDFEGGGNQVCSQHQPGHRARLAREALKIKCRVLDPNYKSLPVVGQWDGGWSGLEKSMGLVTHQYSSL